MPTTSTRARILRSARTLFDSGGLEALSLRKIAAQVAVTPMAIYRHFADKEALVDALVIDGLDRWKERVDEIRCNEPLTWLTMVGDEFMHFALEEPRRFEAAFLMRSKGARRYPDDFVAGLSPVGGLWRTRLEELRQLGKLSSRIEPLEAGLTLWALAQGLVTLYRAGRFAGGAEEFHAFYKRSIRRCLASFVDGRDVQ
jgi:AcrR family transcriptional regulator